MYVCKLRARLARKLPLGALKYVNPIFIYYMCVWETYVQSARGGEQEAGTHISKGKQGKCDTPGRNIYIQRRREL